MPENSAANVDAVSGGASMTRPPLRRPPHGQTGNERWISAADGISSGTGAAAPRRVTRLVARRHHRVDLALRDIVLRDADIRGAGPCACEIAGATMRSMRERKLPERSNATSSVVPSKSPVKSACLDPTMSAIRDSMPGSLTRL